MNRREVIKGLGALSAISPTYLHIREWLKSIRHGSPTSYNLNEAYVEAISTHMAVEAYKTGRKVYWHEAKQEFAF